MNEYIILETMGYLSIIFHLISFLSKNKKTMLFTGMISVFLLSMTFFNHFALMGLFLTLISLFSKILNLFLKNTFLKKYDKNLKYIIFGLSILIFFILFPIEGYRVVFPIFGMVFVLIADNQKNIINMKKIYYGSALSWITYAILINSYPAIIYDIIGIIALTYSIFNLKKSIKN
jgi:hypothetical protein